MHVASSEPSGVSCDWRIKCFSDVMKPRRSPRLVPVKSNGERIVVSFSSGIRAIRNIASFLDVDAVCAPESGRINHDKTVAVVVWGRKQNSARALRYADKHALPVWFLEDGFVRSCDENPHTRKTYSVMVDKSGVYYDGTRPSDIESLLNLPDVAFDELCDEQMLRESASCRQILVQHDITKYNYCKSAIFSASDSSLTEDIVLVVDQTLNDASVKYGGMTQERFIEMLDAARMENPGKRLVVRTHPDVVAGLRQGYLLDYARKLGYEVSADRDNPIAWLKRASRVYVGTSQLGYEALLCGCKVTTFGQPFYAGWGLTDDRNPTSRRVRIRSIDQLFFAAHMAITRYRNPVNGESWTLRECLAHVVEQKRQFARNAHAFACVGISPWKKRYLRRYLRSPDGCVDFLSALPDVHHGVVPLTWSFRHFKADEVQQATRVEDGFLRSKGLGSDFVAPSSLVIDMQGMYFDRHSPSELETLLNHETCTAEQCLRARNLRQLIVSSGVSKYNVSRVLPLESASSHKVDSGKAVILIIGQVEDDESIRRGCAEVNTNSALCEAVRQNRPDDYLIYKPHPDVESGNRKGAVSELILKNCVDELASNLSITQALDACDECHTMTSLTGFEALLREKRVVTYGLPFYAGWGLTQDELVCKRRVRTRTLDELVFFTLIKYPRYLHVETGEFITPEEQVKYLSSDHMNSASTLGRYRWLSKLNNIVSSLRYAA